jgi:NodT family efflux transporter outer membrane factor (OMF) lipoprotein
MNTDGFLNLNSAKGSKLEGGTTNSAMKFICVHLCSSVVALLLLSACAIGPNYSKPETVIPNEWKEAGDWVVAQPKDAAPKGKWWLVFEDPVLNDLMEQVQVSNQDLRAAEARYTQARAEVRAARAGFFPTVGLDAGATRARTTGTRYSVALNAGWELDVWGRIRRLVESASAGEQASAADLEAARLSLQAELATNYFQLRVADVGRDLFVDILKAFQSNYDMTQNRYRAGVVSKVDVVQAETQLLSTRADELDLRVTRATLEHAIATLIGKPPALVTIEPRPLSAHIPEIPPSLPSTLVERRPDVAAAERRMAAANAQIGVAQAAYFPALSLTGSGGFASNSLSNLFSAPSRFWSVGAGFAGTILDFGGRAANVDIARAQYDQAVAAYRQTVLDSFREVEDSLATVHWVGEETKVQAEATRAARESVALTVNQYKAGTVAFINVALVQASQLNAERAMVQLLGRRLTAQVALIRALGGEW